VLERRSAWLVVNTQVKACSSPAVLAGHLKYTDTMPFKITHLQWPRNTTQHRTHCGFALYTVKLHLCEGAKAFVLRHFNDINSSGIYMGNFGGTLG